MHYRRKTRAELLALSKEELAELVLEDYRHTHHTTLAYRRFLQHLTQRPPASRARLVQMSIHYLDNHAIYHKIDVYGPTIQEAHDCLTATQTKIPSATPVLRGN